MKNFYRQYRLTIGRTKTKGFELGDTSNSAGIAPHISFSLEKSDTSTANTGKITVYNLNPEQLNILSQTDCHIALRAGYGANMPLIATGTITYASTSLESADHATEIEFTENLTALRDTYVAIGLSGSISAKRVIEYFATEMGVAVTYSRSASFVQFRNGYSFVGSAQTGLSKVCKLCGLTWTLQNGVLQIRAGNDAISYKAYLLSAETGLVEIPKRITFTQTGSSEKQKGWEISYLLNGAIRINDCVNIQSKAINGVFRVMKLSISGDSFSGDWLCTAQVVEA